MKKRILLIALVATALFAPTNSASADAQSDYQLAVQQYQTALANWNIAMKAEQENFKMAMKNWNDSIKAADQARKEIAANFKSAADEIKVLTIAAVTAAANAKAKKAANAAGKIELDLAIEARNDAMAAVVKPGPKPTKPKFSPAPTPPAKPAKPAKAPKPTKPSKKPAVTKSPTP
jgi:ABC-type transport system involved in cytochrome bd biosynthesis fused ATPase/permease subunit